MLGGVLGLQLAVRSEDLYKCCQKVKYTNRLYVMDFLPSVFSSRCLAFTPRWLVFGNRSMCYTCFLFELNEGQKSNSLHTGGD